VNPLDRIGQFAGTFTEVRAEVQLPRDRGNGGALVSVEGRHDFPGRLPGEVESCPAPLFCRHRGRVINENEEILSFVAGKFRFCEGEGDRGKGEHHKEEREGIAEPLQERSCFFLSEDLIPEKEGRGRPLPRFYLEEIDRGQRQKREERP